MKNKTFNLLIIGISIVGFISLTSQSPEEKPDNNQCLKCHGNNYYSYYNESQEKDIHKKMNPYFVINQQMFDHGVHHSFICTDCHLEEYSEYPHDAQLKLEPQYGCIDCHGEDENFAQFHFDEINEQVQNSIHGKVFKDDFKCEMCHNPHYYQLQYNKKSNIQEIVKNTNQMCLNCHNYTEDRFYLLTDSNISINNQSHKWLPNQELHFKNVRCIECHGSHEQDSLMVTHNIMYKDYAVKLCVECHSDNSMLMSSLYRQQAKEIRDQLGFFNGLILSNSFVIGANRNYYLNAISIGTFSLILLIIIIHAMLRIFIKK